MAGDDRLDGFGDCLIDMGLRFYGPPGPLANKIARTIWALLVRGGIYQAPAAMLKS
jgi:hypothetical protein